MGLQEIPLYVQNTKLSSLVAISTIVLREIDLVDELLEDCHVLRIA